MWYVDDAQANVAWGPFENAGAAHAYARKLEAENPRVSDFIVRSDRRMQQLDLDRDIKKP